MSRKVYAKRHHAVAALRMLGVPAELHAALIVAEGEKFGFDVDAARAQVPAKVNPEQLELVTETGENNLQDVVDTAEAVGHNATTETAQANTSTPAKEHTMENLNTQETAVTETPAEQAKRLAEEAKAARKQAAEEAKAKAAEAKRLKEEAKAQEKAAKEQGKAEAEARKAEEKAAKEQERAAKKAAKEEERAAAAEAKEGAKAEKRAAAQAKADAADAEYNAKHAERVVAAEARVEALRKQLAEAEANLESMRDGGGQMRGGYRRPTKDGKTAAVWNLIDTMRDETGEFPKVADVIARMPEDASEAMIRSNHYAYKRHYGL